MAQKIVIELKDKLINYQKDFSAPNFVEKVRNENSNLVDAQSVLMSLGYQKDEIKTAFAKLSANITETTSAEEILQGALKLLSF